MAAQYKVVGRVAVARVAGVDRYVDRGGILPDGVENLEHLLGAGLVVADEAKKKPTTARAAASTAGETSK